MALSKKFRLGKKDFQRTFRKGKTVKNSFFFVRLIENRLGYGRVAVVVPLAVSKKAVVRNRIRRAAMGVVAESGFYKEPFDVIITATQDIVGKAPREIKSELQQTIFKIFRQHKKK